MQANYAAANSALDEQAAAGQAAGLNVCSVAWGPWATGMAAADGGAIAARFRRAGMTMFTPETGLAALSTVLLSGQVRFVGLLLHTSLRAV